MKKILMVLPSENFREIEYIVPRALWEQNSIEVKTTSTTPVSVGRFGYEVFHDILLSEVEASAYDGIFFVGGIGALQYEEDSLAIALTIEFVKSKKPIGAICIAPRLLLKWDILKGKKCTGWNGDDALEALCEKTDAHFVNDPMVIDGKILTANGPLVAEECALSFLEML